MRHPASYSLWATGARFFWGSFEETCRMHIHLSLQMMSIWDNYWPPPSSHLPLVGGCDWEHHLPHISRKCEVSGCGDTDSWTSLSLWLYWNQMDWEAGHGAQKVSATAYRRSNLTLGIFSLFEEVRIEAAPLTPSLPQEANNVGWRPGSLPFIPRSCQHHETLRKAAPSHEQHTWGTSGGQAGDLEQFFPEQGKEKWLAWPWLLGNFELLTFTILWQV